MNITDSSVDDSRKIKRRRLAEMAAENLVEETTNENISDITAEANPVRTSARIVENLLNGLPQVEPQVEPLRRSARILDKTSSSTEFSSFLSIFNLKITKTTFFCWVNSTKCTGKPHKIYWETEHFILGN